MEHQHRFVKEFEKYCHEIGAAERKTEVERVQDVACDCGNMRKRYEVVFLMILVLN